MNPGLLVFVFRCSGVKRQGCRACRGSGSEGAPNAALEHTATRRANASSLAEKLGWAAGLLGWAGQNYVALLSGRCKATSTSNLHGTLKPSR